MPPDIPLRPLVAGTLVAAAPAFAAPDEDLLGKAEGYPICAPTMRFEMRCLVGLVSRRDEISPARKVARGETVRELKRAASEPAISYRFAGGPKGLDDYLSRNRTTGLLILSGDTILAERYQYDRNAAHRMTSMSMAKTITAMLVGIAVAEGAIASLDDRAEKYLPALKGTPYGETSIRNLLTMSSGIRFTEVYSGSDDVATLVRLSIFGESEGGAATVLPFDQRARPAGRHFHYSSGDTQVLGLVLRAATGKTMSDYLSEKIWKPMGAEADASWLIDKGGYETAYTGFNATIRDYARFGMLLANDGAIDGKRLIPAVWVRAATTPSSSEFEPRKMERSSIFGYGYQTWLLPAPSRQFALRGLRKQWVFVDPASKTVLVHTAAGNIGEPSGELLSLWDAVAKGGAR